MNDKELKFSSLLARVNELPRNQPCSEEAAMKEVEEFIRLARRLRKRLQSMHKPSFEALRRDGVCVPELLEHDLKCAILCAAEQSRNMSGTAPNLGRPKETQKTIVTRLIKRDYESKTGKRATRGNKEYLSYADEKYSVCGLGLPKSPRSKGQKPSPESQLRSVKNDQKK